MEEYLLYNHEYGVVICRQHKYAITKDWIGRHFQEYHKTVPIYIILLYIIPVIAP